MKKRSIVVVLVGLMGPLSAYCISNGNGPAFMVQTNPNILSAINNVKVQVACPKAADVLLNLTQDKIPGFWSMVNTGINGGKLESFVVNGNQLFCGYSNAPMYVKTEQKYLKVKNCKVSSTLGVFDCEKL